MHVELKGLANLGAQLGALSRELDLASQRSLRKVAEQGKTAAAREIKDIYGLGTRESGKRLSISRPYSLDGAWAIKLAPAGDARPFPLSMTAFNARVVKPTGKKRVRVRIDGQWRTITVPTGGGIAVTIKGKRVIVPHAFLATMASGHRGVFARGAYAGKSQGFQGSGEAFGKFQFGAGRKPINEIYTYTMPQAFHNRLVMQATIAKIVEAWPRVMQHELEFILSRRTA